VLVFAWGEVGPQPLLEITIEDQGARRPQPIRLGGGLVAHRRADTLAGDTVETGPARAL
jgi:hypothetical protein